MKHLRIKIVVLLALTLFLSGCTSGFLGKKQEQAGPVDKPYMQQEFLALNADGRITVRKGTGSEDISGDYNEYSEKETLKIHGLDVLVKGDEGKIFCATWTKDGYSFAIVADKGLTKEALSNAIEEMITVAG